MKLLTVLTSVPPRRQQSTFAQLGLDEAEIEMLSTDDDDDDNGDNDNDNKKRGGESKSKKKRSNWPPKGSPEWERVRNSEKKS